MLVSCKAFSLWKFKIREHLVLVSATKKGPLIFIGDVLETFGLILIVFFFYILDTFYSEPIIWQRLKNVCFSCWARFKKNWRFVWKSHLCQMTKYDPDKIQNQIFLTNLWNSSELQFPEKKSKMQKFIIVYSCRGFLKHEFKFFQHYFKFTQSSFFILQYFDQFFQTRKSCFRDWWKYI